MSQWLAPPLGSLEINATHVADGALTPAKTAGTAVVTNDSRLSDARTPTSHDNTKHNVVYATDADLALHTGAAAPHSGHALTAHTHTQLHDRVHSITATTDHSFPGGTTYLRADGTFATPPSGGASMHFLDFSTAEVTFVG